MDPLENVRTTAQELISFARRQGLDLEPLCTDGHFQKDARWIFLWRKDELPSSGPAGESAGTLHYNMQGAIAVLASRLQGAGQAFQGAWSEAGTFEDMAQALAPVRSWLLEGKEVDSLPGRSVRRYGILSA